MSYPYTILVGNSPNLLVHPRSHEVSWESITRRLEEAYSEILGDKSLPLLGDDSLSLRMDRLRLILKGEKEKQEKNVGEEQKSRVSSLGRAWNNWYVNLLQMEPGSVHHLVVKWMLEHDAALITTNYDLTFEKALGMEGLPSFPSHGQQDINPVRVRQEVAQNVCRRRGRVWHMHGEASCPASIVVDDHSYREALAGLGAAEQQEGSWLYQFLHSTVFICGLELRRDEALLSRALDLREELPEESRKPVFYFQFCREEGAESVDNIVTQRLRLQNVECIKIPVCSHLSDYLPAWYHLMGQVWENTARDLTVTSPPSNSVTSGDQFQQCTSQVSARCRSRRHDHTVTTSTPTMQNPERCWINIGVEKLKKNRDKAWVFECRIDSRLYIYHYPSRELEQIFVENEVAILETETPRYNLYIDYRRGELYSTVSAVNVTPLVVLKRGASPSAPARYPQD